MNQLSIDTGVEEWRVNDGGILRFNPADPALYARFVRFCEGLEEMMAPLREQAEGGCGVPDITGRMLAASTVDTRLKSALDDVFGAGNDFNALFEGVSLLGVTGSGNTVLENLLAALQPVMQQAASAREESLKARAGQAVATAKAARREREGALGKEDTGALTATA